MTKDDMKKTVQSMITAPSCCQELKTAGEKWLDAIGTADEKVSAAALVAEAKEDVATIDHVLAFFKSEKAASIFGADKAKAMAAHAQDVKAAGGKWCDCPACAAGRIVVENADVIL